MKNRGKFDNFDFTYFTRSESIKKVAYHELEVKDDHVHQGSGFSSEGKKLLNFNFTNRAPHPRTLDDQELDFMLVKLSFGFRVEVPLKQIQWI